MFRRLSQVAHHLSPAPSLYRPSALKMVVSAGERQARTIHTAACLIIGDEVLGGKVRHTASPGRTNSAYFAKWCFKLGINLKRVEVIEDDESEIIEAARRMSERYDFVVTRHDDITYQSIAKAFGLPLKLHAEAFDKMKQMSKPHPSQPKFDWDVDSPALKAKLRMVELPTDDTRDLKEQVIFSDEDAWVPVAVVNGNIHILPGVPRIFEKLLDGLSPIVLPRLANPEGKGTTRIIISTPMSESAVAPYLTQLAERVEPQGIKVGSYPRWGKTRNTVTLVGKNEALLESLVAEVEAGVKGRRVKTEGEDDSEAEEVK
ncbi:unnamed protein product [Clonostachys rhizophaga]|uniref:MoaB/Mog domain-containing protein n=1 Tax=Clonostachys rhizophaga TaxID=160324 RepID=A0A9N9Y9X0_9HYPO|nr:unnamed protein product [Clonostachys rhizophaga]